MNETESVVILILRTRLHEWVIEEARAYHMLNFHINVVRYSSSMRDANELWRIMIVE